MQPRLYAVRTRCLAGHVNVLMLKNALVNINSPVPDKLPFKTTTSSQGFSAARAGRAQSPHISWSGFLTEPPVSS